MGRKQRQRRWWGVERRLAASCEIWLLNKRPHPENSPNGMAWLAWTPCKQKGARNAHSWLKREQAEHADARYKMAALYVDVECRGEAYTERCPKVAGDLDTLFFKSRAVAVGPSPAVLPDVHGQQSSVCKQFAKSQFSHRHRSSDVGRAPGR